MSLNNVSAQENNIVTQTEIVKDSIPKSTSYHPKTYGLRIGADILRPILATTKDLKGLELVADWRLNTRLFLAGEVGYMDRTIDEDTFNHTVNGSYIKAGVNYNLYSNWLDMDNELYIGARYGFSTFSNTLNHYTIFQNGEYFDIKEVNTAQEFNKLYAHWIEFVAGIKVEVLKNIYFGFMLNLNKLVSTNNPENFENTYSPGFGSISDSGSGANINYTISYRIPLYKK